MKVNLLLLLLIMQITQVLSSTTDMPENKTEMVPEMQNIPESPPPKESMHDVPHAHTERDAQNQTLGKTSSNITSQFF